MIAYRSIILMILNIIFVFGLIEDFEALPPPCSSEIYCHGRLLHTVQMARIFNDSKTFVDMKLKQSPSKTLELFDQFIAKNDQPTREEIRAWVDENFDPRGTEFEPWTPDDYTKTPAILNNIADKEFKKFASDLNEVWLDLGRQMRKEVKENSELYSIIPVDNPVIVPGGRFLEFYYWDSYWVIRGLLISEMTHTAKGMLENFFSIVQRFGFIPNGGRVYYSMRSQPPFLTPMVKTYVDTTNDTEFAIKNVDILAKEFDFWIANHTVTIRGYLLARYGDKSSGPRPESYKEDVDTGSEFETEEEREEHYSELKAGAESGLDFSSRWFIDNEGRNGGDLRNLKTRSIIPVELNAILYWNAKIISEFYGLAGNRTKQDEYSKYSDEFYKSVNEFLWNEAEGVWLDYDMLNEKPRNFFVTTNLSPLFTKCYDESNTHNISDRVLDYIRRRKLDDYPGGVPTTVESSGEQWDYPNVWAPLQHMLIVGLDNLNDDRTKKLALKWAQRWVQSNHLAFKETDAMYEKYLATKVGGHGGGGEYEVQKGFGWSNGVIFDLLERYGNVLTSSETSTFTVTTSASPVFSLIWTRLMMMMVSSALVRRLFL